jgi:predicted DNA-binding transcriptional regulator YafY
VQALFMMSIPQALVELGVGQKLKSALLKLAAAMPVKQQSVQASTQQRIYLDPSPWEAAPGPAAHLSVLHNAIWHNRCVRIIFRGSFDAEIALDLEPLGLVSKMNTWYLVGKKNGYLRVLKVEDILEVEAWGEPFTRDQDFDLTTSWNLWCADAQNRRSKYVVRLRMSPGLISKLKYYLEEGIKYAIGNESSPAEHGWKEVEVIFDNFFQARERILGFGRAAEVLEPLALRLSVVDFARQIVDFYQAEK